MSGAPGLEKLLSAVFEEDEPSPELLARYALAPDALAPDVRRELEQTLADRPDLADEVRTLRSFRPPVGAGAPGARSRWRRVPVWAGAAAAALLVFALTPAARRWIEGTSEAPGIVAPEPTEAQPQAALPRQPAPESAAPAEPSQPPREIAAVPPPQRAEAPAVPPAPEQPEATPPRELAQQDRAPEPSLSETTAPAPSAVAPGPIAMLEPTYSRPPEALERHRMVVAMRGAASDAAELSALAPEHVAFTGRAAPDLFWKLSGRAPEGAKILLRILEERSGDALLETELPMPSNAALQRVALADQGATLAPGVVYSWFVVLRTDAENPARDQLAQGWIERREGGEIVGVDPAARPDALARAGLWYDALASALDLRSEQPDNPSIERGVRALLSQGGVPVEP